VSPAIDTLLALADVLDLDPEYIFADWKRDRSVQVVRKNERHSFTKPGILYERLARAEGQGRIGIEAYMITLEPGAKTGSTEYGHPGWELGVVKAGRAELTVGNHTHILKPGDSASFRSESPHVLANPGKETLRVFWVITPPKDEVGNGN
jgi:uncharacterized cupin superfamily protein